MRLTIANISGTITDQDFQAAVSAIARQVQEDFQPEWGGSAILRGVTLELPAKTVQIQGQHDAIIYVGDSAEDPDTGIDRALGYHSATYADVPFGFVYLDVCARYGEAWSCTLSHEVLELLADPTAALTVAGPDPRDRTFSVRYDLEVCDPVQGDTYQINGIVVSNFVYQAYFAIPGGAAGTNHLGLDLEPFGVRPNGYFQYEDDVGAHQVFGPKAQRVADQRQAARKLMKSGRRNTRRADQFAPSTRQPVKLAV